jgi:hypothetical protein
VGCTGACLLLKKGMIVSLQLTLVDHRTPPVLALRDLPYAMTNNNHTMQYKSSIHELHCNRSEKDIHVFTLV